MNMLSNTLLQLFGCAIQSTHYIMWFLKVKVQFNLYIFLAFRLILFQIFIQYNGQHILKWLYLNNNNNNNNKMNQRIDQIAINLSDHHY